MHFALRSRRQVGFQLMWTDLKISTRLLGRVLQGHTLTRRERKQARYAAGVSCF